MNPDRIVTDLDEAAWDAYVNGQPAATTYHQWCWRRVFEAAFGHETVYFAAVGEAGVTGVLPTVIFESRLFGRFFVSLPFVNYGGVLADTPVIASALVGAAARLASARRLKFLELRHQARLFSALAVKSHKVSMRMALHATEADAWAALDHKVRNQVRKAQKSGLTAEDGGAELVEAFYSVFSHNMRDLGTPVYGRRFFEAVLERLGPAARVFIVRHGTEAVAGAISLRYRDLIEVPWASALRVYLSLAPNNLLYWTIIRHAIAHGLTTLDFGRSTPGEGTFHFKKQWGAVSAPLVWEYWLAGDTALPDLSPKNPRFRGAIALWKHLPVRMTTLVGPPIVRNLP